MTAGITTVKAVHIAELRARIGQTFTLEELVGAYSDVERWGRHAVAERKPGEAAVHRTRVEVPKAEPRG